MNPMLALRQYQKVNGAAQTSEASPHRLVQMLMQGGLDRMAQAKGAIARNDIAQRGILIGRPSTSSAACAKAWTWKTTPTPWQTWTASTLT